MEKTLDNTVSSQLSELSRENVVTYRKYGKNVWECCVGIVIN